MKKSSCRRLLCVTGIGAGDSRGHGGFFYDKIINPLLLGTIYADKDRQEAIIRQSGLDWEIIRPGFLTDGAHTGKYRVLTDLSGIKAGNISRADVADFMLREASQMQNGAALLGVTEKLPAAGQSWTADQINFPAGRRQKLMDEEAKFSSGEANSHLLSFGEFCAMYLLGWCNATWPETLSQESDVFKPVTAPSNLRSLLSSDEDQNSLKDDFADQLKLLKAFRETLPLVRRALANISVLMIFDDHEITDDWYLTKDWRDRVLAKPLGKTVIRNGLLVYALFQGWGNDPRQFTIGPRQDLLNQARQIFTTGTEGPDSTAADAIDALLGLQPAVTDPPVRWNYFLEVGVNKIVVLDTRTRRSYAGKYSAPGLLSQLALEQQVPELPATVSSEVLIVVSPAPVLNLATVEELVQPLWVAGVDLIQGYKAKPLNGNESVDLEAWAYSPETFERLLARLFAHNRVVILSGDVHYSSTAVLDYWKNSIAQPARIVQFISSALKNGLKPAYQFLASSGRFQQLLSKGFIPAQRLGWQNDLTLGDLVNLPPGRRIPASYRARFRRSPVLLPTDGWPDGSTLLQEPDWSWRLNIARDERPDDASPDARPEAVQVKSVTPDVDFSNAAPGYIETVKRYQDAFEKNVSRRIVWASNLGILKFKQVAGKLRVRHELYYVPPDAKPPDDKTPLACTVYDIELEPTADAKPQFEGAP